MFEFDMIFFGISTSARKRAIITEKPSVSFYFFTACCVKVRTTLKSTHNLISGNSIFPPYFQMNLIEVLFKFALVVVSFVTLTTFLFHIFHMVGSFVDIKVIAVQIFVVTLVTFLQCANLQMYLIQMSFYPTNGAF